MQKQTAYCHLNLFGYNLRNFKRVSIVGTKGMTRKWETINNEIIFHGLCVLPYLGSC